MTTKNEVKEPDYESAKAVVDREDAARKDGLTVEKTDPGSGIIMKPDANDRSVRTYSPDDIERDPQVTQKPGKNSGQPVHDRS